MKIGKSTFDSSPNVAIFGVRRLDAAFCKAATSRVIQDKTTRQARYAKRRQTAALQITPLGIALKNAQKAIFPNLKASSSHISLRLPQLLLDELKAAANARDVPYQSLMKIWLAEKVAENSFPRSSSRLKQSKP